MATKTFYRVYIDWQDAYSWGARTRLFQEDSMLKLLKEIEDWKERNATTQGFEVLSAGKIHTMVTQIDDRPLNLPSYISRNTRQEGGSDADMILSFTQRY